ncbi:MAG: NAD-dependent epimerase/dehydratase family protein [Pyrinomonadaceae bacterium]|nr:NAD-dependent epimerase/dehydratase family protein [Pyrinomonadaceae bacterium]
MKKTKALAKIERKILITGGTGFLGKHIVAQLLEAGEKNLRVLASSVPDSMKDAGIEAVEGSITNRETVAEAVKDVDAIFHLAGKVSRENDDAVQMNKVHVEGTRILCEAAKESSVKTIILASSSGTIAVSDKDEILDEMNAPPLDLILRWSYYASKFYQERAALENFDGEGLKLVILNPSLLLGSGDDRLSSTKIVMDFMAKKIPSTPNGGLNFVDAADTATAFINALDYGRHKEKYLLGAANWSFGEFFKRLERLSGVSAPFIKIPKRFAVAGSGIVDSFYKNRNWISPFEPKSIEMAEHFWYFDSSKAERELKFEPREPAQTLQDTISYLRQNFLGNNVFK